MSDDQLLKDMLLEFMLTYYERLESDRQEVYNRLTLRHLNSDDYHDLLVTDIRMDTARGIFRSIRQILKIY